MNKNRLLFLAFLMVIMPPLNNFAQEDFVDTALVEEDSVEVYPIPEVEECAPRVEETVLINWKFLSFISSIILVCFLVMCMLKDGTDGNNKYGPSPKYRRNVS